jgi:hypothetical protein
MDVAKELDFLAFKYSLELPSHCLRARVVGRNTVPN